MTVILTSRTAVSGVVENVDNQKNVENWVELKEKTQAMERFKGRFTYTLLFCVLEDSFRGGGESKMYK